MSKRTSRVIDNPGMGGPRKSRMDFGDEVQGFRSKPQPLKPDDQLQLNETDMSEEIAKVLTTQRTRLPQNLVIWSYKHRDFVPVPPPANTITLLQVQGTMLHKDSEEAAKQLAGDVLVHGDDEDVDDEREEDEEHEEAQLDEGIEPDNVEDDMDESREGEEQDRADDEPDDEEPEKMVKPKKIPNQFNFCERAALTYSSVFREMSTQTIPPPTSTFTGSISQAGIYDEYQADFAQQQRDKERDRKPPHLQTPVKKEDPKKKAEMEAAAMMNRMYMACKALERMINQNVFDDILQDYRYWDDPSDEFKDGEGSLLPLWKFSYEKTKKHDVTYLCFNHRYHDLFAVAYGTLTFNSPIKNGCICLYTLKNPSYPEWIAMMDTPISCLDFNKQHPYLLAVGTIDGMVMVFNLLTPSTTPQYKSNPVTQKHAGAVSQIVWAPIDEEEETIAFYSVSIDGDINHWLLSTNDLSVTTIMTLYLDQPPIDGPDGTKIRLKGCGSCICFHPEDANVFMVGTEEGTIYKCNTAYSSVYMKTYKEAHDMPVYRIVFNKFNSSIFASCSGDWRIKIWEDDRTEPLFMFDLGIAIGDVQWAPYSSTVFACVSNDGKVSVFDLYVNKYRPICRQSVVNKRQAKPTRLEFNHSLPFLIVGDEKGTISTMKLSPNLRVKMRANKKQLHMTPYELEMAKLEKLLSFVREPPVLQAPKENVIES